MDNYSIPGTVLPLTAPSGGVVKDTGYLIGTLFVVATETKAETLLFSALVKGVVDLPKVVDEGCTEAMKVYWDDTAKKITGTVGSNTLVGVAMKPVPVVVTLATDALAADLAIVGLTLQVLDYATLAGGTPPTVTVTVNGTPTVLTEGTEWTAAVSDDDTATSLGIAIAAIVGVEATVATDTVTVVPNTGIAAANTAVGKVRLDGVTR